MSVLSNVLADVRSPLERLEQALNQDSIDGQSKLQIDFKEAYPLFEQHLVRKVRKRMLMDRFNTAYGHNLNLIQFRKLLNAERERRSESGEVMLCAACGQSLVCVKDAAASIESGEEV